MLSLGPVVALWLLAPAATPVGDGRSRSSIAVAPVDGVEGSQDAVGPTRVDEAILEGLRRGEIEIERLDGDCQTSPCWAERARQRGHSRVLLPRLERIGPDHRVQLEIVDVATGEVVASTEAVCEICGEDEILVMASDVAAGLLPRLSRLDAEPARLTIRGEPAGATIAIDGRVVGTVPWEGEVEAGEHELRLSHEGYMALDRSFTTSPGVQEQLKIELQLRAKPETPDPKNAPTRRPALVAAGASLVAVGVAGVGTGAGLFVLDGRPYRQGCGPELVDVNGRCPQMYEASAAAGVMVAVGGAALVAGVAVLVHTLRRRNGASATSIGVRPSARGLTLGIRF
jgi:PEGA domain